MEIHVIENLRQLSELKHQWNKVYAADPEAQFFVSWPWISGYLKRNDDSQVPWLVLAAKLGDSEYIAFFPLKLLIEKDNKFGLYSQLSMAGVTDSHHQGFICLPGYENQVATSFATYLQDQQVWSEFELRHIYKKESRLTALFKSFSPDRIRIIEDKSIYKNELDTIDNGICPYVPLPDDWESYLQGLGASTRKNIRKKLRRFNSLDEFYITQVSDQTIDQHLNILLQMWCSNWESRKGEEKCALIMENWLFFLRHCFDHDCLYLPILWQGDRPVGAVAHFVDRHQKTLLSFISAREETCKDLPPGLILHADSIRYAIWHDFKVYDFLMGNEGYKYSLGAKEQYITTVKAHRNGLTAENMTLNVRTLPQALQIADAYRRANQLRQAKAGYQRILLSQPGQVAALYGLSVIMQREKNYATAEKLLQELLGIEPENAEAWFSLGSLYQVQLQLAAAASAYQQALATGPESVTLKSAIYHNLGYTFQQQEKWDDAIACYQTARELKPDAVEIDAMWANARWRQNQLSPEEQTHYALINCSLGNKRRWADDFQAAIDYYQQAILMDSTLIDAHYYLGGIYQMQGSVEKAIACYRRVLELQPEHPAAELDLANIRHTQQPLSTQQQTYYAIKNLELGHHHRGVGYLQDAIHYYEHAIAMNPALIEAHYHLGLIQQGRAQLETAITCYQNVLKRQPDHLEADVRLANALYEQGTLDPKKIAHYAVMNSNLGHQCQHTGDLSSAIGYYRRAVMMNPELADIRDRLRLAVQTQDNSTIKVSCAKT